MSNRINEDINYMKYLMGYEKGRVISEQRAVASKNLFLAEQVIPTSVKEIKAFQDYMDDLGPWVLGKDKKYYKLEGGGGYGTFGKNTQAAWKVYGKQYLESKGQSGTSSTGTNAAAGTNTQTGIGTNNFVDPVVTITKKTENNKTFWNVEGFAYFPAGQTKSEVAKNVLKVVKEKIFSDPLLANPTEGTYVKVTSGSVRGGASNSDGAPAEVSFSEGDYKKYNTLTPTITTSNKVAYSSNKKFAKNRATNFWTYLKTNLPLDAEGGPVQVLGKATVTTDGFIVDTGGVTDSNASRNWNTNPIPGQHVYFNFTIELLPGKEPDINNSFGCVWKSKVEFSYEEDFHSCDTATFDIWANGIYLGSLDLGNGNSLAGKKTTYQSSTKEPGIKVAAVPAAGVGGAVSGVLEIKGDAAGKTLAQKIVDASSNGEVVITARGKDEAFYTKVGYDCSAGCSTHSQVPYIKATNSKGQLVYDARPSTSQTIKRCGAKNGTQNKEACLTWTLAEFNPCGANAQEGTLSKEITKK